MAKGLTKRQQSILAFIIESIRDKGFPPTMEEIGHRFNILSSNGVYDHLQALERKGYIKREPKARCIHITPKGSTSLYQTEVATLPLLGRVAAGAPILAEENIDGMVPVAVEQANGESYCLRVTGDSMIEDGILDGDVIIVDRSRRPRTGNVVVALVGDEATVKHYHPHGDTIELRPANASMKPMLYHASNVELQGVVVGLQRSLA